MAKMYLALLKSLFSQWGVIIISSYAILWEVQILLIWPIENLLFSHGMIASYLFLPHAVRVIGAWLFGPKVIFALFPIALLTHLQLVQKTLLQLSFSDLLAVAAGVVCAPIALEAMKVMRIDAYPKEDGIISWRTLVFVGFVSSIINSFLNTLAFSGMFPVQDTLSVLGRYVVGDVLGLVVVLLAITFGARQYRKVNNV